MAAPVLESSNSAASVIANNTSLTITAPTGIQVGDLLFAGVTLASQTGAITAPSGWSLTESFTYAGGTYDWFYKIAVSADTSAIDFTFSWSGNSRAAAWIVRISGADATYPVETNESVSQSGTTPDPPSVPQAPTIIPSRDYLSLAHYGQEGKNAASSAPTNYTLQETVATSGGGSPATHCAVAIATRQLSNVNSENPGTFSGSSDDFVVATTLINPTLTTSVTVNATTVACTSTVPAVTVNTDFPVTVNVATIATVATTPAVTVATGTGVTVSPTAVAGTTALPVASIRVNETLLVAVIAGTSTAPAPTVSAGTGVTVSPAVVATAATTPAVTVTAVQNVTVSPAAIAGVAATPAPTITQGTGVTVNVATVATAATTPAVTVIVDDGASPATIAATAAVPAVTVTGGATVSAGTIAATTAFPDILFALEPDTIAATTTVPSPSFTLGQGVTVTPVAVAATSTADASVAVGQGNTISATEIAAICGIPDLGLKRFVVLPTDNILPQIDVVPYHVHDAARSLARFRTPGAKGRNVYILTNGSVTTRQPGDSTIISRTIYGGHESPDDLTSTELGALIAAGYSVEVR